VTTTRRGVWAGAAAAVALAVVLWRHRAARDVPVAGLATSRLRRSAEVAQLAGGVGVGAAVHRTRRVFATVERRETLDAEFELRTAEQVASALGGMKGALMKLGQLASFLDDAMPEPVRLALAQLQQDAPPMSAALCAQVVASELGAPPDHVFSHWDPVPLAAASIGQVHRAVTTDDRAVAVKVQYPGVAEAIGSDLANLNLVAMGLPALFPALDVPAMVGEIKARLTEELDYRHEADNQRLFAEWFAGHPNISVPGVLDELSTARVLTTELADGVRFSEMEGWSQGERNLAAETIYRFVFRSLYGLGAFNGDPHPGNYLFRPGGQVTFLDFGLVKRLTPTEVDLCFAMVRGAVIRHDPASVRRACEDAGFIARGAPVSDERVAEYMGIFWEPVRTDGVTTITAAWASEVARRYLEGRSEFGDVLEYASLPASFVVLQRINLGLLALLGRLQATGNWRRVAEELWPTAGPPSTAMGRAEAQWWAATHGAGR
jgi:predicted unusual protein kinase regulating ubiquinone biosynthesis (AarF/ABC1/UbiB family)